ncbi:DUF2279 domain-containing protein [Puia sp.]|jgi:hypothetical protein|uniref:DUF2279 domain-containing protein n=1 Tax=Puia sp. TaxID=2045100 RepID=UPI002F41B13E
MQLKKYCLSLVLFPLLLSPARGQEFFKPSPQYNPGRVNGTIIAESALGIAVTIGLNYLWYKKFSHTKFHYFNDNGEWLNVDKVGHATTAYNIAAIQSDLLHWGGVRSTTSALIGTATALGFMTMIEIMDGHSDNWGFSKGDMLANLAGCLLYEGQQLMWGGQRVSLKYSYHGSLFPKYYPAELGSNLPQRMLKDYNGQTYWLSFNIASFLPASTHFPQWLNLSAGYGAEGMIGAFKNPSEINGKPIPDFRRYRQFYLSFDTDLYRVDGLSPLATTVLKVNRTFKLPAPTLEWNEVKGLQFHPFYY